MLIGCIRCHGPLDGDDKCPMCDYNHQAQDAAIDKMLDEAEQRQRETTKMEFKNDQGDVIRLSRDADLLTTSFVWADGSTQSLQTRGAESTAIIAQLKKPQTPLSHLPTPTPKPIDGPEMRPPGIDPKTGEYSTAQMLRDEMEMGDTTQPLFD